MTGWRSHGYRLHVYHIYMYLVCFHTQLLALKLCISFRFSSKFWRNKGKANCRVNSNRNLVMIKVQFWFQLGKIPPGFMSVCLFQIRFLTVVPIAWRRKQETEYGKIHSLGLSIEFTDQVLLVSNLVAAWLYSMNTIRVDKKKSRTKI